MAVPKIPLPEITPRAATGRIRDLQLIDERELSVLLGISLPTLRAWRFQGSHLPYYKIGRRVLYSIPEAYNQ